MNTNSTAQARSRNRAEPRYCAGCDFKLRPSERLVCNDCEQKELNVPTLSGHPRVVPVATSAPGRTKACGSKTCERAGEQLPLSDFYTQRDRKDERTSCCKRCQRAQVDRYRRSPGYQKRRTARSRVSSATGSIRKLPHPDRIEQALELAQPRHLTQPELVRMCGLTYDQLGDALCVVIGKTVGSRNGTGPRKYFLKRDGKTKSHEAPLSFSILPLPTTPIIHGGKQ